jgi:hypothetical protein
MVSEVKQSVFWHSIVATDKRNSSLIHVVCVYEDIEKAREELPIYNQTASTNVEYIIQAIEVILTKNG